MRKTKIIATIGPASEGPECLEALILAGVNGLRLNFSHVTSQEYDKTAGIIAAIRRLAHKHGRHVAILQDLGGIKLRLGALQGSIQLQYGEQVDLVAQRAAPQVQQEPPYQLPFPQPDILATLQVGDRVYIADGMVCLVVENTTAEQVRTYVRNGGVVSSAKGVNLPGVEISRPLLTAKDQEDARFGVAHGVDWIGLSFVRTKRDAQEARAFLQGIGSQALLMAKIERAEAVAHIDEIIPEVDGIMVARGDLGIELDLESVPRIQKDLVRKANEHGVVSVVATQMLLSMVHSPRPTRAETTDVATAVLDGCDAILLSDEVAIGRYPTEAVGVADNTMRDIETIYPYHESRCGSGSPTRSIAGAAIGLAKDLDVTCIVVTSTGKAAIDASLFRHHQPVFVLSHQQEVLQKLALVWGLHPLGVVSAAGDVAQFLDRMVQAVLHHDIVSAHDRVILVSGFSPGISGTTNSIQVVDLPAYLARPHP